MTSSRTDAPDRPRYPRQGPLADEVFRVPQRDDRIRAPRRKIPRRRLQLHRQTRRRVPVQLKLSRLGPVVELEDGVEPGIRQCPCPPVSRRQEDLPATPAKADLIRLHRLLVG